MRKLGVITAIIIILFAVPIFAQTDETTQIRKAYECLDSQISEKNDSVAIEEAVFGILAAGSNDVLEDVLDDREKENCWPDPTCRLKETSQVLLAYDSLNKNTEDIEEYLLSKNASATEIDWYLMIDIEQQVPATCSIKYNNVESTINIDSDMKLSGNPGSCLSIIPSGYWMKVSNNCLEERFEISCDDFSGGNFITTLLYQKAGSNDIIYVSPNTHSAPPSGTTFEEIKAKCFKSGDLCDYEGSLWAALALKKAGADVTSFLPYLFALSEDNQRLFPSSFLHILSGSQDQFSEIISFQTQNGFWQIPNTANNKFYDTALALLSLQGTTATEVQTAKDYLLQVQDSEGCWNNNNIRDTAFILYAGWPSQPTSGGGGGGGSNETNQTGGGGGGSQTCLSSGNYCGSLFDCTDAQGTVLNQYTCTSQWDVCCSEPIGVLSTCSELGGNVCSSNQRCSGRTAESAEGTCCLATCEINPIAETSECVQNGGLCDSSCTSSEETADYSCESASQYCCIPKSDSSDEGSSNLWIWITVLIVLIALLVIGIVYRHKLQLWLFKAKRKGGISTSPAPPRRPPFMPPVMRGRPTGIPQRPQAPVKRPVSKADAEMEETLRKLREMSE